MRLTCIIAMRMRTGPGHTLALTCAYSLCHSASGWQFILSPRPRTFASLRGQPDSDCEYSIGLRPDPPLPVRVGPSRLHTAQSWKRELW